MVSNPEFLKEGAAIDDFMKPTEIVVGCQAEATKEVMNRIYKPLMRTSKPIFSWTTGPPSCRSTQPMHF